MTTLFNADTSDGLKITSDTSVLIEFQSAGVTKAGVNATGLTGDGSQLTSLPSGTGPTFSAYASAALSLAAGTATKVQINTEEWDTNANFDTGNYRFTPTVAGYYQVNGAIAGSPSGAGYFSVQIYKNGSSYKQGTNFPISATYGPNSVVSVIVHLNGTTDYVELYALSQNINSLGGASSLTYFQGYLARTA